MINHQDGSVVVSREILKLPAGTLTVFAFDAGQSGRQDTAPFGAAVYILDGEAEVKISGQIHLVKKGEMTNNARRPASFPQSRKRVQNVAYVIKS